ncbi:aldehyde ferredoxin oxidoreductase family protein [Eubacteriaceae bacterium ES3]|nr:aldehyde ferredoxin oxidoreductase family protein [Eubacteriaceae bacterium ES3]
MNGVNYISIDLSTRQVKTVLIRRDLVKNYLGGKALAAKLLYDLLPEGTDPLAEESILIVNTGLMNNTGAPSSSRFNMTFKNVLTGGIASSNCGGQFGVMLKKAGVDGLIITGKSKKPCLITILDGEVIIQDAKLLWGLDAETVQESLPKNYGKLVIGPAGENLVKYAAAVSGERVAGRCGAGAVMGSKNLKGIVAYGSKKTEIKDPEGFKEYTKKWVAFSKNHPMTGEALGLYGSAGLVNKANMSGALPTRNFQKGQWEKADAISGETLADTLLVRNSGCISCPIRCERRVIVNNKEVKGPEFETLGLFGSNIENDDLQLINEINYQADILGMDTISLAGTIAFAMELYEKGLADFGLRFGKTDNLLEVIEKIAKREKPYDELADGTLRLSQKYGGSDFAIHAKGLELASYEPRKSVGMGLGYATSNRGGCHLNGGYLALMESIGVVSMGQTTTEGKAELTVFLQNAMEAVSSAGFCLFGLQSMIPKLMFDLGPSHPVTGITGKAMGGARGVLRNIWPMMPNALPINSMFLIPQAKAVELATGLKMTTGEFLQIGERAYNIERLFNLREGLSHKDDSLPKRLTDEIQDPDDPNSKVDLDTMLPLYYQTRGWTKDGVPAEKTLKRLAIG